MFDNNLKMIYNLVKRRTRGVNIQAFKRVSGWCKLIGKCIEGSLGVK